MKIIAFYLPQYHRTAENDKWWGEGFTEWSNVKKARPLFENHYQPRVPLDNNYYNLLDRNVLRWQANLARKYNVYGFCFYHYWFEGHQLLEKPVDLFADDETINLPYCISWANESWSNAWASNEKNRRILIEQTYGNKNDWKKHFDYLLRFFQDERYIRVDNKPVLIIYRPETISCLKEMQDYWNDLAVQAGLPGICYMGQKYTAYYGNSSRDLMDYFIEYEPGYAEYGIKSSASKSFDIIIDHLRNIYKRYFKAYKRMPSNSKLTYVEYDRIWNHIISHKPECSKMIPGAFTDWDNTPRYRENGKVYIGATPEKFKDYLKRQIRRAKEVYNKDMLFIFAWNEWSEGGYLEPDERYEYAMLEAVRDAQKEEE